MTENENMLGRSAKILCSGERGQIVGHAFFLAQEPQYLIRYKAADGRATEQWWNVSAVSTD